MGRISYGGLMQGTSKEGSVSKIILQEDFKKKSDIHWARKIWHISGVWALFLAYYYLPLEISKVLILILFVLFVGIDLYRLRNSNFNVVITHYLRPIMRQSEIDHLAGTTYLIGGVAILVYFFDPIIVQLSLIFLALADPIASYFGIRHGKDKIWGEKTLQGFLAAFGICSICSFLFLYLHDFNLWRAVAVSFIGGLIGSLAELIPIGKLDDNLTIPVASGLGLSVVFYIFGFLQ